MIRRVVTAYYFCWDAFDELCDGVIDGIADFLSRHR